MSYTYLLQLGCWEEYSVLTSSSISASASCPVFIILSPSAFLLFYICIRSFHACACLLAFDCPPCPLFSQWSFILCFMSNRSNYSVLNLTNLSCSMPVFIPHIFLSFIHLIGFLMVSRNFVSTEDQCLLDVMSCVVWQMISDVPLKHW